MHIVQLIKLVLDKTPGSGRIAQVSTFLEQQRYLLSTYRSFGLRNDLRQMFRFDNEYNEIHVVYITVSIAITRYFLIECRKLLAGRK